MKHEQGFKDALENAKWRFTTNGIKAGERAYEYGILVVKNAFLISGGGLFFIPTMVGLSAKVDLSYALISGICFAASILMAMLGNYIIHINWSLHADVWDDIYEIERVDIRKAYQCSYATDESDRALAKDRMDGKNKWINRTFWLPHFLALLFLVSLFIACYNLFSAFGVVWQGVPK